VTDSALSSTKLVKGAKLKIVPGGPHGMCSTLKDQINAELLAFFYQPERKGDRGKGTYDKETSHFLSYVHRSSVICRLIP
jgi:hypothetical protein